MNGGIVDLFAGPGGWSVGLNMLGLEDIGIELDRDACLTRKAAGHLTVRADVSQYPPEAFQGCTGLIASPPCPDFSTAGSGAGRAGKSGWLVDVPLRWVDVLRPEWVAFEQVPPVLPIWQEQAHVMRSWGYSVWCGVVNAADYGVPQTRDRAVLLASMAASVAAPRPTHQQGESLFGGPSWVSMPDACGWAPGRYVLDRRQTGAPPIDVTRAPAPTLTAQAIARTIWTLHRDGRRVPLTIADALAVQTFPAGYPVQGSRSSQHEQVGNAVPPVLAAHLIGALTGIPVPTLETVA